MKQITCHSGGAEGADLYFEHVALSYNCLVIHYSYRTLHHESKFKYELSAKEFEEGKKHVEIVAEQLKRFRFKAYINLLARNHFQVKNADQVFAIAVLEQDLNGVFCKVKGGTGWAVQMAINLKKQVFVFDQKLMQWFVWDFYKTQFVRCEIPKINSLQFAGIGTRKLNIFGMQAIDELFNESFSK